MTDDSASEKHSVAQEALKGGFELGGQVGTVGFIWKLAEQFNKCNKVVTSVEINSACKFGFIAGAIGCAIGAIVSGVKTSQTNSRLENNRKWVEQGLDANKKQAQRF